jgi:hypothetical protein
MIAIAICVCSALVGLGLWWLVRHPEPKSDPNIAIAGEEYETVNEAHEKAMGKTVLTPNIWDLMPNRRSSDRGTWNGKGWE